MQKPKQFGRSVYVNGFDSMRESLSGLSRGLVFTSFHISEEFGPDYCSKAREMCRFLVKQEYEIIGDVSKRTLEAFSSGDILTFAEEMGISILRLDYGFTAQEIRAIAGRIPVAVNASTRDHRLACEIAARGGSVYAIHNFYPRPETGLDEPFFRSVNQTLQDAGVKVLAFIPGDETLRGPVFAGLPTLEKHRGLPPYACWADLCRPENSLYGVLTGDPGISAAQLDLISDSSRSDILSIPAVLQEDHVRLYGQIFTIRPDSPSWLARFEESREYSSPGEEILPHGCHARTKGSITMDNRLYGRYSGEIQLLKKDFPADGRVNVIGHIPEDYDLLPDCLERGGRVKLVPPCS
ncbi:MupG family TIM beta-alpha barrel fold protein [Lachnospiraceae bacterium 54-53]